ncbi:hypothetical protein [Rhodanobacter terrae]|uniref:Thioredoxin reductase (NADPH) n=1 Tax=Rhodanobacter terrae TaxID=418647 RepID=A0ABW0SVR7_9GAMM
MGGQIGNFDQSGVDSEGMPTSVPFATSRPGIFAVGDVRRGSVKRVASGVGEGSVVIHAVHKFLNPDGGGEAPMVVTHRLSLDVVSAAIAGAGYDANLS